MKRENNTRRERTDGKRSTISYPLRIWIGEGEFRREFRFFPIHGGAHDIEQRHGFDVQMEFRTIHSYVLRNSLVIAFGIVHVIQRVTQSVAPAAPHAQSYPRRVGLPRMILLVVPQQVLDPRCGTVRDDDGIPFGRIEGPFLDLILRLAVVVVGLLLFLRYGRSKCTTVHHILHILHHR